ncbi:putative reverse transcriptase domain-containing protein [Tanacetum coccineum]
MDNDSRPNQSAPDQELRAQLAPRPLQGIFMENMLYRVSVLSALNIDITLCVILLSTSVFGLGISLSTSLQSKLVGHSGIVASGPTFEDALCVWAPGRQEESIVNAIRSWSLTSDSLQVMRETLAESSPPLSDFDEEDIELVLSFSGVAPYNDATLEDLKTKHPFKPSLSFLHLSIDHHHLVSSPVVVLDRIKSFPHGTSYGRDGLYAQHLMDCLSGAAAAIFDELFSFIDQVVNLFLDGKCPKRLGEYIASAPLTLLVKPSGGIRPITVDSLQFCVGAAGGREAMLHSVNRLIGSCKGDVGLSMLLVDFKNAFNLVDREVMLREVRLRFPSILRLVESCYSNPARLYYGEHTIWSCQGVQQGDPLGPLLFSLVLHPLIYKIRDSFILSLHAWYLDDRTIVGDTVVVGKVLELIMEDRLGCGLHLNIDKTEFFCQRKTLEAGLQLVMKRVAKTIRLMDDIAKINDPQCELLLLRSCTGIFRLYFTIHTCPPRVFESAQRSFEVALRSSLERIVTTSGPGFGDWKWRLATLPFAFEGLSVYSAGDGLDYTFLASRLQSAGLQTKRLPHIGIVSPGPIFYDALYVFNTSMETDLLSNLSEIDAPKLMKKMADIYFIQGHTSDWLRTVPISGLGQTMNACSRIFAGDIYGDHVVSCDEIIGIKHHHNVIRDTLVDIRYHSGISAGKEVDIGLDRGRDKLLRLADMLLYSWDGGLDVCVDLTGSLLLTQIGMIDFVPGRAVIDVAQRKRGKYMAKCAGIGYGFLPFSFSSLREFEGRTRISFAIAKRVYERVTMMALNPDLVIRLTKPKHDQNPSNVLETQSEDPKSQKDSPTIVLYPTLFSKKPPKPNSRPISSNQSLLTGEE